jgi:hypothetical protein
MMDLKLLGALLHDLVAFVSPNFQADLHKRVDQLIGGANKPATAGQQSKGGALFTPVV